MEAFQTGRATAEDGVFLHWEVHGDGIPLICSNGVGVSTFFEVYCRAILERLCRCVVGLSRTRAK